MKATILKMYESQRDEYQEQFEKNKKDFMNAANEKEMLEIAKKGAGIKMMLDYANYVIKRAEEGKAIKE